MRLVMMGTGTFAEPTLEALFGSPHQVVGLFTQPDRAVGQERGSTRQTGKGMKAIAEEISGIPRLTSRVNLVRVSVSVGRIDEAAGTSRTSSKVSACRISMLMPSLPIGGI